MKKRTGIGFLVVSMVAMWMWTNRGHAYEGGEVANGGAIVGKVKWVGETPAVKKLNVERDKETCEGDKLSQVLIVSPEKGIKNAVVSLVEVKKGKKLDSFGNGAPQLDQQKCVYNPYLQIIPAGATLEILNNDGILHNIHTTSSANPPLNIAQPKFKKKINQKFDKPETIKFVCDVHSWMEAWVVVADHPYYSVTDDQGAFRLTDVPPGAYQIKVWHETAGEQVKPVTIKEKGASKPFSCAWAPAGHGG